MLALMRKQTMKTRILLLFSILLFFSSCSTNYYICITGNETPLYYNKSVSGEKMTYIPKGRKVIVKGKKTFQKIKYKDFIGWAYTPYLLNKKKKTYFGLFRTSKKTTDYSTYSAGRVYVKGYYRKDGTYVRSHTRSRPKSKTYKRKKYKRKSYKRKSYKRKRRY